MTKHHLKLIEQAIYEALKEVYNIYPGKRTDKQDEFIKLAVEKIKQLSKEKKLK